MINDNAPVIVHSHLRWDFVWQRPQHIFSRLAPRHRIFFIEEPIPGDRLHILTSEPFPNVVRLVPVVNTPGADGIDAECMQLALMLAQALRDHGLAPGSASIQWFYSPMTAPVYLGQFGAQRVVYDCMDELANFRFAPPDIGARENYLLSRADVVFTGGRGLFESKSKSHCNVHFFGCGVDVEHFGKARSSLTAVHPDVAALPRFVLGYFGVIDERLDYELIETLARNCPDMSIVMVGPVAKVDAALLPRLPNIHWLGQREYRDLPSLVKSFDVCLMPFALNDATRYINPTKTLEYMAAGKPIVSTCVPDVVRNFTPIVQVARSTDEFVHLAKRMCVHPDPALIEQGLQLAAASSWSAVVASMRALMLEAPLGHAPAHGSAKRRSARPRLPANRSVKDKGLAA